MNNENTVLSTCGTLRSEDLVSAWNALEDDDSRWRSDRFDASMLLLQSLKAQKQTYLEQALQDQKHLLSDIAHIFDITPHLSGDVSMNRNQLCYIVHLSKLSTPCRKLRKCHMRKLYRRRALARRRYGL